MMMTPVLKIFGWLATNVTAIIVALCVSSALFVILPVLQYFSLHAPEVPNKAFQVSDVSEVMHAPKKRPKPKEQSQKAQTQTTPQAPKAMARSRFAMDLGVGGGSGGGSGGVAIGGGSGDGNGQATFQEGETDVDATPIRQSPPRYPEAARKAGVSGTVRCLLTIDESGAVGNVQILESPGDYGFDEVIREAVSKWRYKPAEVNGIPVKQKLEQPFQF